MDFKRRSQVWLATIYVSVYLTAAITLSVLLPTVLFTIYFFQIYVRKENYSKEITKTFVGVT